MRRIRAELGEFGAPSPGRADASIRIACASGRLDVMGGSTECSGSLVCAAPIDRAAAVAVAPRADRQVQVFSFNLLDQHRPFTLRIPLDALASRDADALRREFAEPGRSWAAHLVGGLFALHEADLIDLRDPRHTGLDIAVYSTIPQGAGLGAFAAAGVATMLSLRDHFALPLEPPQLATLGHRAEAALATNPFESSATPLAIAAAQPGALVTLLCQPGETAALLKLPPGVRIAGIHTGVRRDNTNQFALTRRAAAMGHHIILQKMRDMGRRAGLTLTADPTAGHLANLPLEDYKKFFRPFLPASMKGRAFLDKFRDANPAFQVDADVAYLIQSATDHHVHEAQRIRNFVAFLRRAAELAPPSPERTAALDKAGHLMYASHISLTRDAGLSAPEAGRIVERIRAREAAGFYGARVTGTGQSATVAVLMNDSDTATAVLQEIAAEHQGDILWSQNAAAAGTRSVALE
jgi:galactokinase